MLFYLEAEIQSKGPLSTVKKYLKYIGVGHPGCTLHYAIVLVILRVGESKVLTCREKIIKKEGRRRQGVAAKSGGNWGNSSLSLRCTVIL